MLVPEVDIVTAPFRNLPLRERAIVALKAGHTPDQAHAALVGEGENPDDVRAVLMELIALQQQAAAQDPKRLRGEAIWMYAHGSSIEDVVQHFVRTGIAPEFARPEAERMLAVFRTMRPCQRCGTPTSPAELVFDPSGFSICNTCNLRDDITRSEYRGMVRTLETFGALGGGVAVLAAAAALDGNVPTGTTQPFCPRCQQSSGVHVSVIDPATRAGLDPRFQWVCSRCWQGVA